MRFFASVALISASIASTVFAEEHLWERRVESLDKRQEFSPTTQTATGATCADAFGDGYVVCRELSSTQNRLCYNPSAGQTCCSNSWACPSGSFCFTNGNCCPNGLSTESCAAQLSKSSSSTPSPSSSAPAKVVTTSAVVNTTTSICPTSTSAKPTGAPWPAKNSTVPYPTGSAKPTGVQPFTGAANSVSMGVGVLALGGMVALFGAIL